MMRNSIILVLLAWSAVVRADEGETYFDLTLAPEVAWISHPAVHDAAALPFDSTASFTFLPRVGAGLRQGITNELHAGVSLSGAAIPNVAGNGVKFDGTTGNLITGGYFELELPFMLGWRFDFGSDFSLVTELDAGPMVTTWTGNALADPTVVDAAGLPARLPVDIADLWNIGAMTRLQALFEARLFDIFVITAGPEVGVSWAGTPALHVGLVLRPSLVAGIGPL